MSTYPLRYLPKLTSLTPLMVSPEAKVFVGSTREINVLDVSVTVNSGFQAGGIAAPILNLD